MLLLSMHNEERADTLLKTWELGLKLLRLLWKWVRSGPVLLLLAAGAAILPAGGNHLGNCHEAIWDCGGLPLVGDNRVAVRGCDIGRDWL